MPPVISLSGKELKWCRHSIPNLKKTHKKLKAKNVLDKKKSGNKNNNQLKTLNVQKKAKNFSKNKEGSNKANKKVLAEILSLLWRLV
ncbi:hypothetical protein RhiirC2_772495 [Rhizophagus irregularis]|uniref:Uncharacterized protein n=1 Tax=Rhizophagus irregularis TaxID=588596 RepID=A0A2N1NRF9_9GLOM|nr:hypothetical protein RhiirC2_772495 [Rhizophagus irregularis]